MPLTALLPNGAAVDLTACSDEVWFALYRPQVPAQLSCRSCAGPLHAKVSPRGLRFFAHNRRTEDCPTTGESAEHLALKADLARLIRQSGGTSIVEATPSPGDAGGWRADVLGIGANGRRIAFEAQLAAMTVDVGRERTARYAADGIGTVWVTTRQASWLYGLPGIQVDPDHAHVLEGLADLVDGRWRVHQGALLARCVRLWLAGQVTHVDGVHLYEDRPGAALARSGAVIWTMKEDARRWSVHQEQQRANARRLEALQQRQRGAEIREAEQREAHARHVKALGERQLRLLHVMVPEIAERAAAVGHRVWLGAPNPTFWQEHRPIELADAFGNKRTGFGCPIWTGPWGGDLHLSAVICPSANRVTPALGRSWKDRETTVCVADRREAARVAQALGWPVEDVRIVDAPPPPAAPSPAVSTLTAEQREASQLRLLGMVVPLIAEQAGGPERVFLGRPPLPWNVRRPITLLQAVGLQPKGGSTTPRVWTGASASAAVLHTAVSPDPASLTQDLGDRWRNLGVRVVVETADEAAAIAYKLAWPVSDITLVSGTS